MTIGITIYECEPNEAEAFDLFAPKMGFECVTTNAGISGDNLHLVGANKFVSIGHKTKVSTHVLETLSKMGVKCVVTRSVGLDHIDVKMASDLGITVYNTEYSPDSVADFTVMLILMAVRSMDSVVYSSKKCDFRLSNVRGNVLRDLTVGLIGTGHIGKAVYERLQGFGCRIIVTDINKNIDAEYVDLDELLTTSDIISLHIPLNEHTYHYICAKQISQMKEGAFIINAGRGGLIDTQSLIDGLETGKLGGAALDVLEGEEEIYYQDFSDRELPNAMLTKLLNMENVVITPHTAYYTHQALRDTTRKTLENCLEFERNNNE